MSTAEPAAAAPLDPELLKPLEDGPATFLEEHAKLQRTLETAHEAEMRWESNCKNLAKRLREQASRLAAVESALEAAGKQKAELLKELESSRKQKEEQARILLDKSARHRQAQGALQQMEVVLAANEEEAISQQKGNIARLELELSRLSQLRDKDLSALTKSRSKSIELHTQLQELRASRRKAQGELEELEKKISDAQAWANREQRRKADLDQAVRTLQQSLRAKQAEIEKKKAEVVRARNELDACEDTQGKLSSTTGEKKRQLEELTAAKNQEVELLRMARQDSDAASRALARAMQERQDMESKVSVARQSAENKRRLLTSFSSKVSEMEKEKLEVEAQKKAAQFDNRRLKDEITALQLKTNANAKQMDVSVREREVLSSNHQAKSEAIQAKEEELKMSRSTLKNIKNEYQGYLLSVRAMTKITERLRRDKAALEAELQKRQVQNARAAEEVAERELKMAQLQQQILSNETKLRQQQNLLEAVRSDRNLYRKTLIEQKTEMAEYKRKFSNLSMQIRQLKAEIGEKDAAYLQEHMDLEAVRDEAAYLKQQNERKLSAVAELDEQGKQQAEQVRRLATIIADADEEIKVQTKQYNAVVNEQRVLSQQLVGRNEELGKLYEQLKLQASVMRKSATTYAEKVEMLRQLRQTRGELETGLNVVMGDINKFEELKATIGDVQRLLLEEQLKGKALTDELAKPINVHRWRQLQDTNSEAYGRLRKVRVLQKELIRRTEEVEEKESAIQDREKLYVELKRVLARQPGPESMEQLRLYASTLRDKKGKLKTIKGELKVYQSKVYDLKYEIGRLQQDLRLVKLSYFEQRRKAARGQGEPYPGEFSYADLDVDLGPDGFSQPPDGETPSNPQQPLTPPAADEQDELGGDDDV